MSLRLRLTLTLAGVLWLLVLGLGAALYLLTAADLRTRFALQMQTLAQQYAQLALNADRIQLREPPPSPLRDELEGLEVYLLGPDGRVVDSLGVSSAPLTLPAPELEAVHGGQVASLDLPAPWTERLLGRQRGAVLYPIFALNGDFRVSNTLALLASDTPGARSLERLRTTILAWVLLATLLALLVGDRLALWLSRPLREIATTARAVGAGALGERIPRAVGRDEIGRLKRDLNAMLARLETLVTAQRRFTADAAHDLRTPLAVLRTELEVTLRRPRGATEYRASLTRLLERVVALSGLAEDLLTLARLEAGQERPFETLPLLEGLSEPLETAQHLAEARGLEFSHDLTATLEVQADPATLPRLATNLLDNAAKAARHRFGLSASADADTVTLRVWDDGPGVAPELRARLFQRFAAGEGSRGTGLGLAIAGEIARAHGGTLRLEPASEGTVPEGTVLEGTVFTFQLRRAVRLRPTLETQSTSP